MEARVQRGREGAMTVTFDLPPILVGRLREEAGKRGIAAEQYLAELLEEHVPHPESEYGILWRTLTPEEWQKVTREWSESFDPTIPPLPDEAVSRESFYEDRC
jgi:hypothetical protein